MKHTSDNKNMKRSLIVMAMIVVIASPKAAFAVDQVVLTNDQIEHIRNNCGDTQTAISSIRATDKVAYVNIGQQVGTLSSRLIAPMNSRVALNKLDGVALAKTAVDFNTEVKQFQELYRDYEESIGAATTMGCYNQPVEFYDNLTTVLRKRGLVRQSLDKITVLITQYRVNVEAIQKQALTGVQQS